MKRILALCVLCFSFSVSFAKDDLGDKVQELLMRMDTCASAETIDQILQDYKNIIIDHGTDWRSYYWLAYGNMKKAEYSFDKSQRDRAVNVGLSFVERARLLRREHPELDILEALLLIKKIQINPDDRENKYLFTAKELLSNAYYLDQLNPRYYYVKGLQALGDTAVNPSKKDDAIAFFKSAEKLFGPHDAKAEDADPAWGFSNTQMYLNVLIPGRTEYYNKDGEVVKTILDVEAEMSLKEIEKQLKKEAKQAEKERKRLEKEAKRASAGNSSSESEEAEEDDKSSGKDKDDDKDEKKKDRPKKKRNLP